jgi:glucose/arabinose dehydrogenase
MRALAGAGMAALVLLAAGCGDDEEPAETAPDAAADAPVPAGDGEGGVRLEPIGQFDQPLYVTQPPDSEDLYVVEKPGRIRLVRDDEVVERPVLDISDKVSDSGEQGFLSIAFAPDFAQSRLLYAYYTDSDENQRVVEFEMNGAGTEIDPASEREVLVMDDFASNHNGGLIVFGPDDQLYIGTGDGGIGDDVERTAQDLGSLLGKILRIDPAQNGEQPYTAANVQPVPGGAPEIYAYGLRNPWRFSFDRATGALTIGDVGQNAL